MNKKKIVVSTEAGVSKEQPYIETFRDSGGTWDKMDVNDRRNTRGLEKS